MTMINLPYLVDESKVRDHMNTGDVASAIVDGNLAGIVNTAAGTGCRSLGVTERRLS